MKTILENPIDYKYVGQNMPRLKQNKAFRDMTGEYTYILRMCTTIEEPLKLIDALMRDRKFDYFMIGCGGNHLWVHQKAEGVVFAYRLIFVDFAQYEKENE